MFRIVITVNPLVIAVELDVPPVAATCDQDAPVQARPRRTGPLKVRGTRAPVFVSPRKVVGV